MILPLRSVVCGAVSLGILSSCGIQKSGTVTQPVSWKANQVWHGELKKVPKYIVSDISDEAPKPTSEFSLQALRYTIRTFGLGLLYVPIDAYKEYHGKKEPVPFDLLISKIDSNGNFSGYWDSEYFRFRTGTVSGKIEGSSITFHVTFANKIVSVWRSLPGDYTGTLKGETIRGKGKLNNENIGPFSMNPSSLSSSAFMKTYNWNLKRAEEVRQENIKKEREQARRDEEANRKERAYQKWLETPEGRAQTMKEEQERRDRATQRALDDAKTKAEENAQKIKDLNNEVDKLKASQH